ncbi:MAG: hypothetical protein LBD23_00770, partial [Oscillospiraceae bacterium]|nr:hypothetical protein [Oscillospiraceae bacterium]
MKCPNCGEGMTKLKKKWLCEECDYSEQIKQTNVDNLDELFYLPAFDEYYPLLAHEYHVLYSFMKDKNYFGALLQYKDVVEIIIKLPTLIAINHLWRKDNYTLTKEKEIMKMLLEKPLSLGDWKAVCGNFVKLYDEMEKSGNMEPEDKDIAAVLKPLLHEINVFFDKGKIVYWRNNSIGHGALQSNLESDKKHISDFSAMLTAIAKHFEKN